MAETRRGSIRSHENPLSVVEETHPDMEMNGVTGRRASVDGQSESGSQATTSFFSTASQTTKPGQPLMSFVYTVLTKEFLRNTLLVLGWYCFSLLISVYNKWMFGDHQLSFNFPLFTTSLHMVIQHLLAAIVLKLFPQLGTSAHSDEQELKGSAMTASVYFKRIVPCATATGLDIGLGNMAFHFVTLSFATMVKSTTLGFVLLFAILFKLEYPSLKLAGIIAVISIGIFLMAAGETDFSPTGFVLLLMASASSGLRWSLTQILIKRNKTTPNAVVTLYWLTPAMFIVLFVLAIPVEGFSNLYRGLSDLAASEGFLWAVGLLVFPGCIAFLMTITEFVLLQYITVVSLSVCGIFKEVAGITAGAVVFGDTLTPVNIAGAVVTISAIMGYNYAKTVNMIESPNGEPPQNADEEQAPMLANVMPEDQHHEYNASDASTASNLTRRSFHLGSTTSQLPNADRERDT